VGETVVEQWEDVASYLAHIAASGTRRYGEADSALQNTRPQELGMPLQTFRQACTDLSLPELRERTECIATMASAMLGHVAAGQTVRRTSLWTRQGQTVNMHRVLRGDLGRAWKKSVRRPVATPGLGRVVVVIPISVSSNTPLATRYWMLVASCVLAEHAYRQGRPVEIWTCGMHPRVFQDKPFAGATFAHMICLKRSQDPWDTTSLVLTTYVEWQRRLQFRALELHQEKEGTISPGYGGVATSATMLDWLQSQWALAQSLPPECIVLGCSQHDRVESERGAQGWVQAQLKTLEHVA